MHLLGLHERLLGLGDLRPRQPQRQRPRLASGGAQLDGAQHLLLERAHAPGDEHPLPLHHRPVVRGVDVAVHRPAQPLDLGVGQLGEPVGRVPRQAALAGQEDRLVDRRLDLHPGAARGQPRAHGERDLRVGRSHHRRRHAGRLRPRARAPGHREDRRVRVGEGEDALQRHLLPGRRIRQRGGGGAVARASAAPQVRSRRFGVIGVPRAGRAGGQEGGQSGREGQRADERQAHSHRACYYRR